MIIKVKKNDWICFIKHSNKKIWCYYWGKKSCFNTGDCREHIFVEMSIIAFIKYKLFGVL